MIFMMEMKIYFSDLTDSRDNRGRRHELQNIIVMSIYAVLCGYTDAENMAFFMKLQEPYFSKMLDLKYGVPYRCNRLPKTDCKADCGTKNKPGNSV